MLSLNFALIIGVKHLWRQESNDTALGLTHRGSWPHHVAVPLASSFLKLVSGRLKSPDVAKIWILARVAEGFAAIAR